MLIAVTGASGFVGGHVARRLVDEGHRVIAYGRRADPGLAAHARLEYRRWDIVQARGAEPAVDAVVHCAGSVTEWGRDAEFEAANVTGTENVVAAFQRARRFVLMSSASVYDLESNKLGITEDAPLARRHLSGYVRTKIAAEMVVLAARPDGVVLRPHAVYGPGDRKILPRLVQMRRRLGFAVVPGTGRNRISLTHADNLVDAALCALRSDRGGIFNIADDLTATVDELLMRVQEAFGLKPRIVHVPAAAAWPAAIGLEAIHRTLLPHVTPFVNRFVVAQLAHDFTLDLSRARDVLGYRPRRNYAEALTELAAISPGKASSLTLR